MPETIYVAQGLLVMYPNVLMAHRVATGKKPLMWEYPGGKLESGETYPQALKRELKEELDIDVEVGRCIHEIEFLWKEDVFLRLYVVSSWTGIPKPVVASELRWVDPEYAIDYMPCLPGAYSSYRDVMKHMKELSGAKT